MADDEPPWLSPSQQAAWLSLTTLLVALPRELDAQMRRDADISQFEYIVLAMLSEAPDDTRTMTSLSTLTGGTLSRLSHVVSRLAGRGWVTRAVSGDDARSTNVTLTDEGYAKVVASAPRHVEHVRTLVIDALSDAQLRQLERITEKILAQIRAQH
ncbi:MAG: MarR family winged helix-turn-helix transcriptional regulator [Kibdelosporangium sp.]